MTSKQVEQNLTLFQELVSCNNEISLWCFDSRCNLLYSNCPYENIFYRAFSYFGCDNYLMDHSRESTAPLSVSTPINLTWLAAYEREEGSVRRVWALGPIFQTDVTFRTLNQILQQFYELDMDIPWKSTLHEAMDSVPLLSPMIASYLTIMLHYCVTGEKLKISDTTCQRGSMDRCSTPAQGRNCNYTWVVERNLLRMVREGDLNYREGLAQCASLSSGVPLQSPDPLRQAKDSVIVSISIICRAAIEGGLSPEIGYAMGDAYIQNVENCKNSAEVGALHGEMLEDFVQRVHKCRNRSDISPQIQACCDYIETHTEEPLTLLELSSQAGYADYYLSKKFRAEMNVSLNDYIKIARCERAKLLLTATELSISEISSKLQFCSRSHFGAVFRKIVGCTPAEYRSRQRTY